MIDATDFLTALPDRAVIALTGPDARDFLQRVITQGPDGVAPERAMLSALLTPQGKVLSDFLLFDDGDGGLFLDAPASEADGLVKRLSLYRLRADAAIERREDLAVIAARGAGEAELKTIALAAAPDPRAAALGWRAIAPAGGPAQEQDAYHTARIAAGAPEFGPDYGPGAVFSTDVNHDLMQGIDYKKGCFVGQEVASRMHRKGGVRKRTVRLRLERDSVAAGASVHVGDTPLGEISSASGSLALARLRVDRLAAGLDAGETLTVDGAGAQLLDDLDAL